MKLNKSYVFIIVFLTLGVRVFAQGDKKSSVPDSGEAFTIVSFPDFFNFDVPEPWPRWDTAVNWFLDRVEDENPEFVLVTGDLVNGHWNNSTKCIEHSGATYYGNWKRRLKQHNLRYYVAIGDHELGDDPWSPEKVVFVPDFERVFAENMQMPQNGPTNKKGLAYYVRHENLLVITVETFETIDGEIRSTVAGEQLEWVKQTLEQNKDADFIIVQGHIPVFGNVKAKSSSMLMLEDSTKNEFWQLMKNTGVDLYLCGEFHAVTILETDGIWQIVHGSSWGRKNVDNQSYLVITVDDEKMELQMKSFAMEAKGENMWNLNKDRGPLEIVEIPEDVKKNGPRIIGTLTIQKNNKRKEFTNISGCFK